MTISLYLQLLGIVFLFSSKLDAGMVGKTLVVFNDYLKFDLDTHETSKDFLRSKYTSPAYLKSVYFYIVIVRRNNYEISTL